jgi:hypothetical protein
VIAFVILGDAPVAVGIGQIFGCQAARIDAARVVIDGEAVAASFLRALGLIAGLQVLGPRAGGGEDKSQGDGGK